MAVFFVSENGGFGNSAGKKYSTATNVNGKEKHENSGKT